MKNQLPEPDEVRLSALLRESRTEPALPAGFRNAVWRRIGIAEARRERSPLAAWLDHATAWLLRPRRALAGGAALLLLGVSIGVVQGGHAAHDLAMQQYLTAVSPPVTR